MTMNQNQSMPGSNSNERLYNFKGAFADVFDNAPASFMDTAKGSENDEARVARLLNELKARHNNLLALGDVQRARVEALTLHETWYTFARASHGSGNKAASMVELAQSDAWAEVHDTLAGTNSFFSRTGPAREETRAWRERMRSELDETRAKEYIRRAEDAKHEAETSARSAKIAAARAENHADRSDIRANASQSYSNNAAESASTASVAAAEARVHAMYAAQVSKETAEKVVMESLAAQGDFIRDMMERVLKEYGIKPKAPKVEAKAPEASEPVAKAS